MSKRKKHIIVGIISLLIIAFMVSVYLMYMFYYYKEISIKSFINHSVVCANLIINFGDKMFNVILLPDIAKIIIISLFLVYLFRDTNIIDIINSIKNIEIKGVKIEMQKMEEIKKETEKKAEDLKDETDAEKNSEVISLEKRVGVMQIMIDNYLIVDWLYSYIKKNARSVSVPMNIIPTQISLETISKIFEYELKSNSIKLVRIKSELEPIVIDVFNELLNKGVLAPRI